MSAIVSRGRRGSTIVPNWRWEDASLDPYELRIMGWLVSHADQYVEDHVSRNEISRRTGISQGKVSYALAALATQGLIEVKTVEIAQRNGGHRLLIIVDIEKWEDNPHPPRSWPDRAPVIPRPGPGRDVTGTKDVQIEEQEEDPPTPRKRGASVEVVNVDFERFWLTYNRTGSKKVAYECWRKAIKKEGGDPSQIQAGLEAWMDYWSQPEAAKMKWPQGWLNEERWRNQPPPVQHRTKTNPVLAHLRAQMGEQ